MKEYRPSAKVSLQVACTTLSLYCADIPMRSRSILIQQLAIREREKEKMQNPMHRMKELAKQRTKQAKVRQTREETRAKFERGEIGGTDGLVSVRG